MPRTHPFLILALLYAFGIPRGWAQSRSHEAACPATLPKVREACGCEPREEAAFNMLSQTRLNSDNLRSRIQSCFKLDASADISRLKLQGDAALSGCLSQVVNQFPEYRKTLAELVAATKDVPPRKLDIWLSCYGKALGHEQGGRTPKRAPSSTPPKPVSSPSTAPSLGGLINLGPGASVQQIILEGNRVTYPALCSSSSTSA